MSWGVWGNTYRDLPDITNVLLEINSEKKFCQFRSVSIKI